MGRWRQHRTLPHADGWLLIEASTYGLDTSVAETCNALLDQRGYILTPMARMGEGLLW
jgi:hypothetical protein